MKNYNFCQWALCVLFFALPFVVSAQTTTPSISAGKTYFALYANDTYTIINQTSLDDMLQQKRHSFELPVLILELAGQASISSTQRPAANGAGTRLATSQASTKPGLKSITDPFYILCPCKDKYVRAEAWKGGDSCKASCADSLKALSLEMKNLESFLLQEGLVLKK